MELDQKDLMNEYIAKQNKMIGEQVNKILMLESQVAVAFNMIEGLEAKLKAYKEKDNSKQEFK
jgi:hypothetical protein